MSEGQELEPGASRAPEDDAAQDTAAVERGDRSADADFDAALDRLDDGGSVVGVHADDSDGLPFLLSTREHFSALGEIEVTGDARVDAATARLTEVPDLPTAEHVTVYDDVHRRLQDALSDADVR